MSDLSPAAQAVMDAFLGDTENTGLQMDDLRENVAAALRAVVDQVVPISSKPNDTFCIPPVATMLWGREVNIRRHFLAIAEELDGVKYGTYRCNLKGK